MSFFAYRSVVVGLLLVGLTAAGGCEPSASQPARSDATDATSKLSDQPADAATGQTSHTESQGDHFETTAQAKAGDRSRSKTSTRNPTAGVKSQRRILSVQPTQEQLARWRSISHEPLQLLACRERDTIANASHILAVGDDKHYLVAGSKLSLWSVASDTPEHIFYAARDEKSLIKSVAIEPGGKWCAIGTTSGELKVFSLTDRQEIISKAIYADEVAELAIAVDASEIATISYGDEVTIWNSASLEEKARFPIEARGVEYLKYIGPNLLLAAGETMATWNTGTSQRAKMYNSARFQTAIGVSPDAKELVYAVKDGLQRWSLIGDKAQAVIHGNFANNEAIAFSANGQKIATANGESIRIWDAATGKQLQVMDHSGNMPVGLCWLPQSNLLAIASDSGRVRIWGTPLSGQPYGLAPLHRVVELPLAKQGKPSTVAETLAAIDLRQFPRLPETKAASENFSLLNYTAAAPTEEARLFYRYWLDKAGWEEELGIEATDSMRFVKQGFALSFSSYAPNETETYITLNHLGNFDIRDTPKLDRSLVEPVFESPNVVMYKAKASLIEIETSLLKLLHQAGWTALSRLNSTSQQKEKERTLEFVWNGTVLSVWIQPDREEPTKFMIQYSLSLTLHSIPIPQDSGLVEWDNHPQLQMVANTSLSLSEATEFYDAAMQQAGWLRRDSGRSIKPDGCYLPYIFGQHDITIGLEPLPDARLRIRVGKAGENSWQLMSAQADQPDKKETNADNKDGLEAADIPILEPLSTPLYDASDRRVTFEFEKLDLGRLGKRYIQEMETLGWEGESFGGDTPNHFSYTFRKGSAIIYCSASIDPIGIGRLSFQGPGLLWTKQIKTTQPVSYATWLRNNKHPATLDLIESYKMEMAEFESKKP